MVSLQQLALRRFVAESLTRRIPRAHATLRARAACARGQRAACVRATAFRRLCEQCAVLQPLLDVRQLMTSLLTVLCVRCCRRPVASTIHARVLADLRLLPCVLHRAMSLP